MIDFSKITVRPIYTAPRDAGQEIWVCKEGHFPHKVSWDQTIEKWVPADEEIRRAIRIGTCEFDPDYWIVEVDKPEETIWNGYFWVTPEEIEV